MSDVVIERVGVVGCGLMGSGIAEVCARAGLDVMVREVSEQAAEAGRARLVKSLDRGLSAGKLSESERDDAVARLAFTTDLADFADRQLVVEAVVEDEAMKVEIFRELDRFVTADGAILASNTSSIPIMKLGTATKRPEQVIGIHFFNPVPVLRLVELVTSLMTSEPTLQRSSGFATDTLNKRVIRSKDRAGFVVNALLIPYLLSAIRMMESGFASAEDIDTGMVEGCSHPMGPLHLTDLIGLDTTLAVAESLYEEFKEPLYAPPPLLSRMVDAGLLGRKTGRGFYEYSREIATRMTDRVERLTNLLALLLETPEPLSLVAIAGELVGHYPEGLTARRATFERDKAALREIGVPIEQEIVMGGEYAGQTRYWIDRERYELRDLRLEDDETRALQLAMAATRPGSTSGQEALWKLGAGVLDRSAPISAVLPDLPALPLLRESVAARTSVSFEYRQVERTVDPWGLLLRDGFWYLIGFDHGRSERRTYRIDRIEGDVTRVAGSSFVRPADFDPRHAMPDDPKMIGATDTNPTARVLIDAVAARGVIAEIGEDRVLERRVDGSIEVDVACANLPAFRSWVLGFLEYAEVLEPADVREHIVEWLQAVGR